jgi:chaperonin GroEL
MMRHRASPRAALLYATKALAGLNSENNDQKLGIDIVRRAPQAPAFDVQTGSYTDMMKAGIIDPTKVVRLALKGAASIAGLLTTTGWAAWATCTLNTVRSRAG